MKQKVTMMLIPLSVLMSLLSAATGTYVVYFPNMLIPGMQLQVRVLVQNSDGPVSVCASLKFAENGSTVAENTKSVRSGKYTTIPINVPDTLRKSKYKVDVSGTRGLKFSNSSGIHYSEESLMVFIQTDKTRYAAGQTVKYRAVLLLPNLLGYKGEATVLIQDGQGNKIEARGPDMVTNGVISGIIELSRYPVFGSWKITVDAMGRLHSKSFEVNEYVLPRFTVDLTVPSPILLTQTSFKVGVKASFTFKAQVNGNCTLILYNEDDTVKNFKLSEEIKGSTEFVIPISKLKSELNINSNIKIRAMVMDNATALTMVAERRLDIDSDKPVPVTITKVDVYKNSYVPGIDYHTKIFVGRNGKSLGKRGSLTVTPTVTTAVLQNCAIGKPPYQWVQVKTITKNSFTIQFDEHGYADLTYKDSTKNAEKLSFKILFRDPTVQSTEISYRFEMYPLTSSLPVIRMSVNKLKAKVGDKFVLDVTATENLKGDLTFDVYARGDHVMSERTNVNNDCTKTHTMTARKEMVPRAFITVNHLTRTGQLIADYIYIEVEGDPFNNEVELSYNATQIQPGQTINMRISADPSSTVFVLAEDQRNRIFGVDNDIFWSDVVTRIIEASADVKENIANYGRRYKRTAEARKLIKRSYGPLGDLDDTFIESGLIVLSNAKVSEQKLDLLTAKGYKRECKAPVNRWWGHLIMLTASTSNTGFRQFASSAVFGDPSFLVTAGSPFFVHKDSGKKDKGLSLEEIVRSRFPDTWLWDEYEMGSNGVLDIAHKVPDSTTTWVTSAFALNSNSGFGICRTKPEVTVKKNFFLTMDLPSSIVHGEEFLLQISVFNNFPISKLVFLRITLSEDPNNPIPSSTEVKGNDGRSTYIRITPKQTGILNITAVAYIMGTFFFTIPDKITKSVTVRPNGVFKTTNEQHLIDVTPKSGPVNKNIDIPNPPDMIENTKFTKVTITGNFMTPTIDGLDNLIRIPYGCGEQTMLNFAPSIYITNYLTVVGKLTPKIKTKSTNSLKTGLQRELKYQRRDGSFSAFGNRDSAGSSWLTAFVLKCFGQAKELIKIDNSIMVKAMDWLLRCQNSDGSFREPGRVIHYQMQGGSKSDITMSAFIVISLLENRNLQTTRSMQAAINKATGYLEAQLNKATDSYTLAIICYALASAESRKRDTCFTKLKKAALTDGDKVYWRARNKITKREVGDRSLAKREPSIDVEASSYALLTYVKLGKHAEAFSVVKWLVSQRNPNGGERSTQDTIISIQALAEFASSGYAEPGPEYGVTFNMSNFRGFSHVYSTDTFTFDFVHSFEVPNDVGNFFLQATGSGSAVIDVSTSYYVSGNENDDNINVDVTVLSESINTATIKSCLRWTGSVDSGMLLMEVEMPTGFKPDDSELKKQSHVMKHETNGRNVALYFNGVNRNTKLCVDVKMDRVDPVVKSQACHVKAYDYYDPVHQAMTRYELGILKSSNICNVCPLCSFCQNGEPIGVGR